MDFTLVDGGVAILIVISAILAYSRGLVREALAILGWVGAAVLAYSFAAQVQPFVKEVPVVGDFLSTNCELSLIAAFAAVFAAGLVIASLFAPLLSSVVQRSILGGLDQGLGFLFGVLRGVLLVAIGFIVYDQAVGPNTYPLVDNARSAKIFASFQSNIDQSVPKDVPGWIVARYEDLTRVCAAPGTPAPAPAEPAPSTGG